MSKTNKVLSLLLVLIVIIIVSLFINNMYFGEKEIEIVQTTSIITKIENNTISLENEKQFTIKDAKKDQRQYHQGDHIRVEYDQEKDKMKVIPAITIFLIKANTPSVEDPKVNPNEDIQAILNGMTLEEKVAQMFMVRCPKNSAVEHLKQYQMGGYILFDANIYPYTNEQFFANNQTFQETSNHGLLIGIDEEGGSVTRLSRYTNYRPSPFASPQELYANGGFEAITNDTIEKSKFLKQYGINVNFAPVADTSTDPNDFINNRSFGKNAKSTSQYIKTVVDAMKKEKVGSVLKHFPGYGNNADTHTGSAYDERPYENFLENDFLPFEKGIQMGTNGILVSHNIIDSIDSNFPASLSLKIHEVIRNELHFDGVIFTDDLIMHAITNSYGDDRSAVLAIQAGNDMLLSSDHVVQIPSVIQAVQNGEIKEDRINASVLRILKLKKQLQVLK